MPNKKECPSCAMEIEAGSKECPICGYEFPQQNKTYHWIALVLVVLLLLFLLF
jgi:RNA polymerase subunit RPABC4/transcription elongation factor Spt4